MKSHLADKSTAPDPVSGYWIYNKTDHKAVDAIGKELWYCSAIAPETIVADVAQNTVWKIKNAQKGTPSGSIPEP